MDPLALLSNLHGDGPSTLHRLRRAGCDTLASLEDRAVDELAPILGWKESKTERFLREARHLSARLGEGLLDEEDADAEREERGEVPEIGHRGEPEQGAEVDEGEIEAEGGTEETLPEPIRAKVLERWRELDRADYREGAEKVLTPAPRPSPDPPRTPLAPGQLDGLDARTRERLAACGVRDLETLLEASDLDLAARSGIPFTRLVRLRFLARRALGRSPRGGRGSASQVRPTRHGLDAAGPFA